MYLYDVVVTDKRVLCGPSCLCRCGLISWNSDTLDLMTDWKEFNRFSMCYIHFYYYETIDTEHYVWNNSPNPLVLQPTKERAIVDYINGLNNFDEGLLIEGLKSYIDSKDKDIDKLYEVADFYKLQRETVDYWIKEAEEYCEV